MNEQNQNPAAPEEEIALEQEQILEDNLTDKLKAEVEYLKDQLLRALAENENIIKRAQKQVEDANKFAASSLFKDLINIIENLHRTIDNITPEKLETDPFLKSIYEGVNMILKDFSSVMIKNGLRRIAPNKGDKFDHNLHQAVAQVPSEEFEANSIIEVMQAGYAIHERLLRPAMVVVSKETA